MSPTRRRIAAILCAANLLGFAAFILVREPGIHLGEELEASRQSGEWIASSYSGQPLTHIASRPLYSWNDWHGGEALWVKALEIANFPALIVAHGLADPMTRLLFPGSGSYYLESWVRAWMFVGLAVLQWVSVGWMIHSTLRVLRVSA